MRTLTAGQESTLQGAHYTVWPQVWVADSEGDLQDLSASVISVIYGETIDELVGTCTVVFDRGEGSSSLAPLMSADPPIDNGREIVVKVATVQVGATPGGGDYVEVFRGVIDRHDPARAEMVVDARDQAGALADVQIQEARPYGSEEGIPLETVMQQILDDNLGAGLVDLYVPLSPEAGVQPYEQQEESLLQALRTLVESIGWTVRYRWHEASDSFRLTLYEPDRAKTTADWTLAPSRYLEVKRLETSVEDVRNKIRIDHPIRATGGRGTVVVTDSASVARYGGPLQIERFMRISEASESPVDDAAKATALANAALNDLSDPEATHEVEDFLLWHLQIGDLIAFPDNSVHYSADQKLAVVGLQHAIEQGRGRTVVTTRGKPAGGFLMWRRRDVLVRGDPAAGDVTAVNALSNVVFTKDVVAGTFTLTWRRGAPTVRVLVWDNEQAETATTDPLSIAQLERANLGIGQDSYTGTLPAAGHIKGVVLGPYDAAGNPGPMWRRIITPAAGPAPTVEFVHQVPGVGTVDVYLRFADPQGMAGTLYVWTAHDSYDSPDPTNAAEGSYVFTGAEDVSVGPSTIFTLPGGGTATLLDDIRNGQKADKVIFVQAVMADGRTTGQRPIVLQTILDLVDNLGVIEREQITRGWQFGGTIGQMPYLAANEAGLPADNSYSDYAVAIDTGQGYHWDGNSWGEHTFSATDRVAFLPALIAGAIKTVHLEAGSVTTTVLSAEAVTAAKIAAGEVTTAKLAADAVTANKLAAITLQVGKYIQSADYVAGVSGWRIEATGDAELNDAVFRGEISGARGFFSGLVRFPTDPIRIGEDSSGARLVFYRPPPSGGPSVEVWSNSMGVLRVDGDLSAGDINGGQITASGGFVGPLTGNASTATSATTAATATTASTAAHATHADTADHADHASDADEVAGLGSTVSFTVDGTTYRCLGKVVP